MSRQVMIPRNRVLNTREQAAPQLIPDAAERVTSHSSGTIQTSATAHIKCYMLRILERKNGNCSIGEPGIRSQTDIGPCTERKPINQTPLNKVIPGRRGKSRCLPRVN